MDLNLKKMWPALAASLVAFTTVVNADYNSSSQNTMTQQNGTQVQVNVQNQPMVKNGVGPDMMITPNAYHTNTVFFSGEALFWWAREGGLEFGIQDSEYDDANSIINNGKMLEPCPGWNAGFRLGLGYVFHRDGWDLDLWWTHYQNGQGDCDDDCDDCCVVPDVAPIITMWSDLPTDGNNLTADDYSTKWKVNLNIVDLELGRAFMTSKWLELRPFVGVRGAWTNESYKINYFDVNHVNPEPFDDADIVFVSEDRVSMKNKWWGVGPKAGVNSRWGLCWGFSLYGDAAISLLYGKFKVRHSETIEGSAVTDDVTTSFSDVNELHYTNKWETGRAVTDIALGLEWGHDFDGNWGLGFNFGWEQHLFFNANQFWRVLRTGDNNTQTFAHERGDLSFQGFTLGGRIYF
ncbi:MAG: Lpg1974 family pore-forming outer membrane protein [Chlamydiota bacterium]